MFESFRSLRVQAGTAGFMVLLTAVAASAQVTRLDRQLSRIDVAASGYASITKSSSGTNYLGDGVSLDPATTLGALVQIRYTKSPLLGFEGTYSYARYTENFTSSSGNSFSSPFGVQTNASEYSLGYVAHLPSLLGVQPFASVGAGSTAFKPTPLGGQGLPERALLTYYYDLGVDDQFLPHFGFRAQFRQAFFKAPDFDANYLNIHRRTFTSEPAIGVYFRF